ncbi:hypothetical protein [Actinoplanes sp. G11-F43]|uniref:hypothetical protein n=1 Tax=Actinoplanes sp. G11-F43 TaxID=3424130 RepID=UPI003D328504
MQTINKSSDLGGFLTKLILALGRLITCGQSLARASRPAEILADLPPETVANPPRSAKVELEGGHSRGN